MPIRDVDLVAGSAAPGIRIAANRGANGIDGVISSGLGAAVVWDGPVAVLAGDLAFLHDLTALAAADRLGIPLDIVVVDNNGGGIFHFLPQAGHPDVFERHFGTPHDLDLAAAARGLGVEAVQVSDAAHIGNALREPPAAPRVLIARTDRETNVAIHHEMTAAIERNLAG
jgi:2-succinyl-5-enolpyruvyl-6-hydroxy-3-cyclohexene-1-carboxylate synthase